MGPGGCCIAVSESCQTAQQSLLAAAARGDLPAVTEAAGMLGKSAVQACGFPAMQAAAQGKYFNIMAFLKTNGIDYTHGPPTDCIFVEAVRTGNLEVVRQVLK